MTVAERQARIRIRPAVPEDAEGLVVAFLESAEHHARLDPDRYRIPDADAVVTRYRERPPSQAAAASVTLVAERGGEIMGFVEARCERSPDPMHRDVTFCHALEIAVSSRFRSQGVGGRLLAAVEDWGRRQGATFALLEYHVANTRAAEFYQRRMGYTTAAITAMKRL